MHHNPDVYPDPDEFKAERFLDKNEPMTASTNRNADERDHFNFGWGRYVCMRFLFEKSFRYNCINVHNQQ